jgi:hypothetical protein
MEAESPAPIQCFPAPRNSSSGRQQQERIKLVGRAGGREGGKEGVTGDLSDRIPGGYLILACGPQGPRLDIIWSDLMLFNNGPQTKPKLTVSRLGPKRG